MCDSATAHTYSQELLLNVLNASTTKRDAKAYLSRFKSAEIEPLHLALVILRSPQTLDDFLLDGVGRTLSHLSRLGLQSVVVLDVVKSQSTARAHCKVLEEQCDRLVSALQKDGNTRARRLDYVLGVSTETAAPHAPVQGSVSVQFSEILAEILRNGTIPVIPPIGYSFDHQLKVTVDADEVLFALTRGFIRLPAVSDNSREGPDFYDDAHGQKLVKSKSKIDRVILLDAHGGLPSKDRPDNSHIFVNLEQEYKDIESELSNHSVKAHFRNLTLAQKCLSLLPPSSSALLTTPAEAATLAPSELPTITDLGVVTRRPKNPLVFNLLTDKPTMSSSLPPSRVRHYDESKSPAIKDPARATFFKRGMPVTLIPDPRTTIWRPPLHYTMSMSLDDPRIDFGRLLALIEDSFGRPLDVEDYVNRIRNKLAGIIVAGEYEGGALLTWEVPPGVPDDGSAESCRRMVPYLDKFAVLKRSQGAGGVADIVFSAMVRSCFPHGVCWRSRKNNPVNKWYFERSAGSWKLPDSDWSMFWTTPNLLGDHQRFRDYESVCRSVKPSWADRKHIVD